jgi:hypothetical protein
MLVVRCDCDRCSRWRTPCTEVSRRIASHRRRQLPPTLPDDTRYVNALQKKRRTRMLARLVAEFDDLLR